MKTNVARLLDTLRIPYTTREYLFDPDASSAEDVARKIGMPAEQVFKTLLCTLSGGEHVFAVLPGNAELDLKKLAAAAGAKRAELAALKELEPLTGYVRGGVTAMCARRDFAAYADEVIEIFDVVSVSAGVRGLQLLLAPRDYLRATHARVADLCKAAAG